MNVIISKIPHSNSKILFVLGFNEYLERLEGRERLESAYSFMLKYSKITVWSKDVCIISNIKLILILQGISTKVCIFYAQNSCLRFSAWSIMSDLFIYKTFYHCTDPYCVCTKLSWMNPSSPQWGEFFMQGYLFLFSCSCVFTR